MDFRWWNAKNEWGGSPSWIWRAILWSIWLVWQVTLVFHVSQVGSEVACCSLSSGSPALGSHNNLVAGGLLLIQWLVLSGLLFDIVCCKLLFGSFALGLLENSAVGSLFLGDGEGKGDAVQCGRLGSCRNWKVPVHEQRMTRAQMCIDNLVRRLTALKTWFKRSEAYFYGADRCKTS